MAKPSISIRAIYPMAMLVITRGGLSYIWWLNPPSKIHRQKPVIQAPRVRPQQSLPIEVL